MQNAPRPSAWVQWSILLLGGGIAPLSAQTGHSLLLSEQPAWNGWGISASVKSGYRQHGGAGEVSTTHNGNLLISPFARTPGATVAMTPVETLFLPDSGVAAKDEARGKVEFVYQVGAAATNDSFEVRWNTSTSAVNALHDFGAGPVPADAFVEIELVLATSAPVTGGSLRLPALPLLTAAAPSTESLVATVIGPVDGFFVAGDPALDYPLTLPSVPPATPGRTQFTYTLTYSIVTPYGADPEATYTLRGGAVGPAVVPPPPTTTEVEAVRREMPVVRLDKLVYDDGDQCVANVLFADAADIRPHNLLLLVSPATGDYEFVTLGAPSPAHVQTSAPLQLQVAGAVTPTDNKLHVGPGGKFLALYFYQLPGRIGQGDAGQGILPGQPYYSLDFGLMYDPAVSGVSVQITPGIALQPDEENRPPGHRRLGTLAVEGRPGILQLATEDLVAFPGPDNRLHPSPADRLAELLGRIDGSVLREDSYLLENHPPGVWKLCRLSDAPAAHARRAARIRYLPQLLALCGVSGRYHASNERTLAVLATGLEMWLEGFNCALNPRLEWPVDLSAPEGIFAADSDLGREFSDSMLSPDGEFLDDPLQQQRDLFAAVAMQDHDTVPVRAAFLDLGFAPNPDFRGYPDSIPQFNVSTGIAGPHAAEGPGTFRSESGAAKWHGNGTVTVAGGVFGNRYAFAGPAGQVMRPTLFKLNEAEFAFECGAAIERAVVSGVDVINISAGFPCRILTVLGPIRICSVEDRAAVAAAIQALVAAANGLICAASPAIDAFLPGLGALACTLSTTATATTLAAFFESLYPNSLLGDPRQPMERGVESATANGVPIVASSGNNFDFSSLGELAPLFDSNNRSTADWEVIPASIPDVLSVGATGNSAPYANIQFHGPGVDLWAPTNQPWLAPRVEVDDPDSVGPADHIVYQNSGTSFSAPFVTGVICQMMAANPSLHRGRATAPQRATVVSRLTSMLGGSATAPGSRAEVPASDPGNPEVALRGPLAHALAAREAARADAGVPALDAYGFNPRFARYDDETGARPDDTFIAVHDNISGPMSLGHGGLCHGDRDRFRLRLSSVAGSYPSAVIRLTVPASTHRSPPPVLFNGSTPLRSTGSAPGLIYYDFRISGCHHHDLNLSTISSSSPFPASPVGVGDVLYRLEVLSVDAPTSTVGADRFESGLGNDTLANASGVAGTWSLIDPPYSLLCAAGSRARTIADVSLHGCEDIDHYRIGPWSGYSPTETDWTTLEVTLDPPAPGVRLTLSKQGPAPGDGYTRIAPPGDGNIGLTVNGDAWPLPLILSVEGTAAHEFDIRLRHCVAGSIVRDAAGSAGSARGGQNPHEFFEQFREMRWLDLSVPRGFGFPDWLDLVKFSWPRDEGGRSTRGQAFHLYHSGGNLRFVATPLVPEASLRLDVFNMNGVNIGGGATADIEAIDGQQAGLQYHPQSQPMDLDLGPQPAGDYFLGVSGFKLSDSWDFLPGASLVRPGYPNVQSPLEQLLHPQQPELPEHPMHRLLTGFNQRLGQALAEGLSGQVQPPLTGPIRIEYSLDGEFWHEAGGLFGYAGYFSLVPPPGVQVRFTGPWSEQVLNVVPFFGGSANQLAIPTEPGTSFHIERSEDLEHWLPDPSESFLGDGTIFHWPIVIDRPRAFFRAVQDW